MLDAAEIAKIRMEGCRALARTPTGVEHGLLQNEEKRAPQASRAGRRRAAARCRPRSRYDAVDHLLSGRLRLNETSGRIVRRGPPVPGRRPPDDTARSS